MSGIGYACIFVLNLVMCVAFLVILLVDIRRIKKIADRSQKKMDILCDLITLDQTIQANNISKNAYLLQIDSLLKNEPFGIDKKKIMVCKPKKGNELDQKIYRSYKRAPASAKAAMLDLSEIFGRIYELNHPVKFRMLELKKNIKLHFLLFALKLCCFLIEYLEKRDEKKNKAKINSLKKHQKNVKKYPSQVLLNGFDSMCLAQAS